MRENEYTDASVLSASDYIFKRNYSAEKYSPFNTNFHSRSLLWQEKMENDYMDPELISMVMTSIHADVIE